ncbi:MAG: VCBS repeat-containing protein [Flavobacteriales bacterium]|nr:MAG: VCBS repeat-containing protein [Flavobacteriales bacterium]
MTVGDFNGNGRSELLVNLYDDQWNNAYAYTFEWSTNPTWSAAQTLPNANAVSRARHMHVMDYDGDGKQELIVRQNEYGDGFQMLTQTSENTWTEQYTSPSLAADMDDHVWIGDVDGDGKDDVLVNYYTGSWWLYTSTGANFSVFARWKADQLSFTPFLDADDETVFLADFNGDGRADIFRSEAGTDVARVHYSMGYTPTGPSFSWTNYVVEGFQPLTTLTLGDMNGDGKHDVLNYALYTEPLEIHYFNKGAHERSMTHASNGMGALTTWTLAYTSDAAVYTQETYGAGLSEVSTAGPMEVVAGMSNPDGVGGRYSDWYSYENAWRQQYARRFMGFERTVHDDIRKQLRTERKRKRTSGISGLLPETVDMSSLVDQTLLHGAVRTYTFLTTGIANYTRVLVETEQRTNHLDNRTSTWTMLDFDVDGNVEESMLDINGIEEVHTTTTWVARGPSTRLAKPELVTVESTRDGVPPVSKQTNYTYYTSGRLDKTIDFFGTPQTRTTDRQYNNTGNLVLQREYYTALPVAGYRTTQLAYDAKRRYPTEQTIVWNDGGVFRDITTTTTCGDPRWGAPTAQLGPDGLTTLSTYDSWGRTSTWSAPHEAGTPRYELTYEHDWAVDPVTHQYTQLRTNDPGGADRIGYFDLFGREVEAWTEAYDHGWHEQTMAYDAAGRLAEQTVPHFDGEAFETVNLGYDDYHRLSTSTSDVRGTSTKAYSVAQNGELTVTSTTPAGHVSTVTTDGTGKTVRASDDGGELSYSYDSWGNLLRVKHGGQSLSWWTYDSYGRRETMHDVDAGTTAYAYDGFGQITTEVNALGQATELTRDNLGRVLSRTGEEGTTTYTYFYQNDRFVNVPVTIEGPDATFSYEYDDSYNRMTKELRTINGVDYPMYFTYDDHDRLSTIEYGSQLQVLRSYFDNGALATVETSFGTVFDSPEMNGLGQYTGYMMADGNELDIVREHGWTKEITAGTVQDLAYDIEPETGNMLSRYDRVKERKEIFTYDDLDRLKTSEVLSVLGGGNYSLVSSTEYEYDEFGTGQSRGNLEVKSDVGQLKFSGRHKVSGAYNLDYPNPNNQPPKLINLETQTVEYTPFQKASRVMELVGTDDWKLDYTYGPDQQRVLSVLEQNGSGYMSRVYAGSFEKVEQQGDAWEVHYIGGGDGLCAMVVHDLTQNEWKTYAVYKDHQGSLVTLTDADGGSVVTEQAFDAWGRWRNPQDWGDTDIPQQPFWLLRGYTGHEHMEPFASINMNGRLYDPVNGRMFSADNYVQGSNWTQGYNRYAYAANNPMKYTDPTGDFIVIDDWLHGFVHGYFSTSTDRWDAGVAVGNHEGEMAARIWAGLGQTDSKNDFWGQSWEIISRLTWQSPQTAFGLGYGLFTNMTSDVNSVETYGGATVINVTGFSGGVTIGSYITGGTSIKADPSNPLFQHEYGHYLQSKAYGPWYMEKVALPSLISAASSETGTEHGAHPVEQDANRRSFEYMQGRYEQYNGWNHNSNTILVYDATRGYSDASNRAALQRAKVSLEWYDFAITGFTGGFTLTGGIVNVINMNY